jgi:O-antigen ligase
VTPPQFKPKPFVQNVAMNMSARKAVLPRLREDLRRVADDPALANYLFRWVAPALFALLVSATIRFHSLFPTQTMSRVVGNLLALAAIAFLLLLAGGCRLRVHRDVVVLSLGLAAAAVVSVLGSGSADISLLRLELYLSVVLLATAVYLAYRDRDSLPLEAYFLGIALVHLPFLFAAIQWISEMTPPFWAEYGVRIAAFANVRQFAEFGFLAAVSATALGLRSRRLLVPSFLLAASALFGIILTGSRGALLSWLLFVLLLCCFGHARLRAALHGLLVLVSSAGLVWYLDKSALLPSPNIFSRVASQQLGEETFDSGRLRIWQLALEQIMVRPLFGSGPEGYWLSGCCARWVLQAHNFVLQFLLEFGLVGCGIAVLLAARAVKGLGGLSSATKLVLVSPHNRLLACLLASFLAYSLIDQMMYHLLPLLHLALFGGLFAAGLAQALSANGRHKPGQAIRLRDSEPAG